MRIVRMTADEAIAVQRDVTDVYRAAFGAPPYNEGEAQVQQFRDDMLPRHTQRDGFRFVVALESGRAVHPTGRHAGDAPLSPQGLAGIDTPTGPDTLWGTDATMGYTQQ
jgi:hypothetical protein